MRTLALLPAVLLATVAASAPASQARTAQLRPQTSHRQTRTAQLQANRAAARRDARALLGRLRLPSDLTPTRSVPRWAVQMAALTSAGGISAADRRWWTTTADPQAIIDFISAHRPARGRSDGTGGGHNYVNGVSSLTAEFSWPPVGLQLYDRTLTVTVVTPPQGASFVVAQSQSFWIVPRPASELAPSRTRVVDVTLRIGRGVNGSRHMRSSTYVVWRPPRVAAIVRQFNVLQTAQGAAVMAGCTLMMPDEPRLTLSFRAGRGRGHPALAHAQVFVSPGRNGAAGLNSCDPIEFWIGTKRQPALTSPTFVSWIGRLIGARIS